MPTPLIPIVRALIEIFHFGVIPKDMLTKSPHRVSADPTNLAPVSHDVSGDLVLPVWLPIVDAEFRAPLLEPSGCRKLPFRGIRSRTKSFDFDAVQKACVAVILLELSKLRPQQAAGEAADGFVLTATAALSI